MQVSRRSFLGSAASSAALIALPSSLSASIAQQQSAAQSGPVVHRRLTEGWEVLVGPLASPWAAQHSDEIAVFRPVSLPHCFNATDACDPDASYYRGQGWYRTHVAIANPFPGGRTLLHFEGAGQTTSAFVNETFVGKHVGGYDEFVFDITEAASLTTGKRADKTPGASIAVVCDNAPDQDRIPSDLSDFSLYGGLYRHVNLVYVPAVSIENVHVRTELASAGAPGSVSVHARLYNPGKLRDAATVQVEVTGPGGGAVHRETSHISAWDGMIELTRFSVPAPQLWSAAQPNLYECKLSIATSHGDSAVTQSFGFRKAEFIEHGPFELNGTRLLLRGTHRHEDHAGYAAAMPDELIEQEMRLIKAMGANFIRLAHYQQSRRVLDLCDRLGILVWEELPWCRAGVGSDAFVKLAMDRLTTMIDQHSNHRAIILWGLGNEDDWPNEYPEVNQDAIRGFMTQLNDVAHKLDASRATTFRRCDFARDIPDVYSPSIWAGWYSGRYTEYEQSLEKQRGRVKRLFHAEWGADSHAGRHSEDPDHALTQVETGKGTDERGLAYLNAGGAARVSRDGDWSESYACNLFDWHLKVQESLPWLTGTAQWIFKDFTTPLRVENPVPRINQKGLIQRDMTPKESYYVFQSYWSDAPMAHIYGHTWPVRWGKPDEPKMVKVYSNCAEAELFVNGKSVGVKHRESQNFPAAGLRWVTPFKPGANHLRVVAKAASGKSVTDEINFSYQTEVWSKPAVFVVKEKSRVGKAITVGGLLLDEHGIPCLDARNQVRFTLAGAGRLIDNQGTPTGSRVVQLINGRTEITVDAHGECVVGIESEGIPSAFCTLNHA